MRSIVYRQVKDELYNVATAGLELHVALTAPDVRRPVASLEDALDEAIQAYMRAVRRAT